MLNVVRQFFPTYHCRFIKQYYYYAIFNGTRRVSRTYLPVSKVIKCVYYTMLVHTQILLYYIYARVRVLRLACVSLTRRDISTIWRKTYARGKHRRVAFDGGAPLFTQTIVVQ